MPPGTVTPCTANQLFNKRLVFFNFSWLLWDRVFRLCGGLVIGVWLARYLGPEDYGRWSFAASFVALFAPVANLGLDSVVVRDLVRHPEKRGVLLGSAFALKLAGSIAGCVMCVSFALASQDSDPIIINLIALTGVGLIFQSFGVVDFHFQSKVMSKWVVVATNLSFTLAAFAKIYLFLENGALTDFAWVGVFELALTAVFLCAAYKLDSGGISDWSVRISEAYRLLVQGLPLFFAGLAVAIYMRVDIVMLQYMTSTTEVGVYAAAVKVSEVMYFMPGIIVSSLTPALVSSYQFNQVSYGLHIKRLYFFAFWAPLVTAFTICVLSETIVTLLFSGKFIGAAEVLSIHAWASVAVYLGVVSSQFLIIEGLQKVSFYRTLIGCVLNILLNLWLIPVWGASGAALATVVSYFVATYSIVFFPATRRHFNLLILSPFKFREVFR
jgi:O-antigen/teichoic acid export membrane protein